MEFIVKGILWTSLSLGGYLVLVYPLVLWLLSRRATGGPRTGRERRSQVGRRVPKVSVVILPGSREKTILDRLDNILACDYPAAAIEILVGCSGEIDLAGHLVATFNDSRVQLVQRPLAEDAAGVINECLRRAEGDVIVLTTADVQFSRNTLRRLVDHFRDRRVGIVCGRLVSQAATSGQTFRRFWGVLADLFERHESRLGVLPQNAQHLTAVRRSLCGSLAAPIQQVRRGVVLSVSRPGFVVVRDTTAIARLRAGAAGRSGRREFAIRLAGRGRGHWFYWATRFVLTGRLLRRFLPVFLVGAVLGNAVLATDPFYLRLLLLQELAYLGVLGFLCYVQRKQGETPAGGSTARLKAGKM